MKWILFTAGNNSAGFTEYNIGYNSKSKEQQLWCIFALSEFQIRGGIEDNSKIIFLVSQ